MSETVHMDPLMKAIKALHYSPMDVNGFSEEDLMKQRRAVEVFSSLAYSPLRTLRRSFKIGSLPLEWIYPLKRRQGKHVILYCHGGGYTCGGLRYARMLGTRLAKQTSFATLTFAYRLAPENPYPAQLEDARCAWDYLTDLGFQPHHIILAGDSAGGNLALELCLDLKKRNISMPGVLVLFSPWTDMTAQSESYETYRDLDPILTKQYILNARRSFAGSDRADFRDPAFSPLFADLKGLPPVLIQAGSNEILRDDSEKLVKALRNARVKAALQIYKGGWHVFQHLPTPITFIALKEVADFVRTVLTEQSKSRIAKNYLLNQLKKVGDLNKSEIQALLKLINDSI